jgi:hypothetical protein
VGCTDTGHAHLFSAKKLILTSVSRHVLPFRARCAGLAEACTDTAAGAANTSRADGQLQPPQVCSLLVFCLIAYGISNATLPST